MEKNTFRANDFAPQDGKLLFYFKKFSGVRSDAFAAVFDGQVYVIDVGSKKDGEMICFLAELRESWLTHAPKEVEWERARLEIHLILSHPHPDHVGALPLLLADPRFCVVELIAPKRSYRSLPGPDFLPELANCEALLYDHLPLLSEYHHKTAEVTALPYGKIYPIRPEQTDVTLTVYPAPFDWSEDPEHFRYLIETSGGYNPSYGDHPGLGCANGNSLWVKIQKGKQVVLITGDQRASDEMLGHMLRFYGEKHFRCDVLKLTHHGKSNYPPDLIELAAPAITVFTVSREQAEPQTKALCEEVSTPYYLGDGSLFLTLDGEKLEAKQLQ